MESLEEDKVRGQVVDALASINRTIKTLESWKRTQPILSTQNQLWARNQIVLKGIRDCLDIELNMLDEARNNPSDAASPDERKTVIETQYLLFLLIDAAARDVKTNFIKDITSDLTTSSKIIHRNARRSQFLHWRVVNLATGSAKLRNWYSDQIEELRKTLLELRGSRCDVFLAHVSKDKELVEQVISDFQTTGQNALATLHKAIDGFNGETSELKRVFSSEQEKLDTLSLGLWFDKSILIPGDNLNAEIKAAIQSASVFLVFITPHYDLGTYMREVELPQISDLFQQLRFEKDVRAIPVVLSPGVWNAKRPEWVTEWRPVTCPPEPEIAALAAKQEKGLQPQDLLPLVVASLTSDKLLKSMTGADLSDLISAV